MNITNKKTRYGLISIAAFCAFIQTACTDQGLQGGKIENAPYLDGLFVTRPEVDRPLLSVIKLKNPALLETAQKKNGELQIDKKLLAAIEKEQEEMTAKLAAISPEIRVLIRYKLVLNGMAVWMPAEFYDKVSALSGVTKAELSGAFDRPQDDDLKNRTLVGKNTSVNFIGSEEAHKLGLTGQGMRVGVIDTGIDYTHAMFLGEGTPEAYKAVNPNLPHASFPNKKVVGGIDLAGTEFNTSSPDPNKRIPKPDMNPLDEGSHGTHVAGSVAGIGDGINTYSGVAPDADLYAIKVFGAKGSTSDAVVIAALEYSVDPTGDLSFKEQLDIVNLSLGSGHGSPHIMYNEAIRNTVRSGTVVVAAAGNNGDKPYIVGAPGVSNDAISVASTVDNQNQNVQFSAVAFSVNNETLIAEAIEAAITKKLSEVDSLSGEIIDLGMAAVDLTPEQAELVKGKIAFVERGIVGFADKIKRAANAGAVGVIVMNNSAEAPIVMGGEGNFKIPAVMIPQKEGQKVRAALAAQTVVADMKTSEKIQKPWLADTVSLFSSRGPRSSDGVIKPEVAAPGSNIISASVGEGNKGKLSSGTSMASPHIAGVMALLKQRFPTLSPAELKSVVMTSAKTIHDENKKNYSVSRQGAGRVQVANALNTQVITIPSSLSFGITDVLNEKTLRKEILVKNIGPKTLLLGAEWNGDKGLDVSAPKLSLAPGESQKLTVTAKISTALFKDSVEEVQGYLKLVANDGTQSQIPALAVVRKISDIQAEKLLIHAQSSADAAGSAADLFLKNTSSNSGESYLFNLLGTDGRKKADPRDVTKNRLCDLQSSGYRVIEKNNRQVLQFALKLYEGQTTWHSCEVNVQIDSTGDNIADQEIAGLQQEGLAGLAGENFVSMLLDGTKARALRKQYEHDYAKDPSKATENYAAAVMSLSEMTLFDNGTLAIIEAPVGQLKLSSTGALNIKVSTTHQDAGVVEYDDYLDDHESKWHSISIIETAQGFYGMPTVIKLEGQSSRSVPFNKGYGSEKLVIYSPMNKSVRDPVLEDSQSQVIVESYKK